MDSYRIEFKPTVEKDLSRLPQAIIVKALERIESLSTNPFPADIKKLKNSKRLYRIRLGDYRIVFEIDSMLSYIIVHYIRHRKDVYRKLKEV